MSQSYRDDDLQWFALSVKPRFDKAVTAALDSKGFETFIALRTKRTTYSACRKEVDLPIFPGYVFCRFDVLTRLPILTTPGVLQILGTGTHPSPIPDPEITSLKTATAARISIEPFPFPPVGRRVYIQEGVLAGVQGTVVNVKHSRRIVLSITLLRRSVLLETDCEHVTLAVDPENQSQFGTTSLSA